MTPLLDSDDEFYHGEIENIACGMDGDYEDGRGECGVARKATPRYNVGR